MIFVDTGGWFAATVPMDPDHTAAARWLAQNAQRLVTTDYVVDETLTLLKARGQYRRTLTLGEHLFDGTLATVYYLTEDDLRAAWHTFIRFSDKEWSFTDCTSKVVIERFGLTHAFAFDTHFRQFGSVAVVP